MCLFYVCPLNLALAKCVREAAPKTETLHLPSLKRAVLLKLQVPCPTDLPPASPAAAVGISAAGALSLLRTAQSAGAVTDSTGSLTSP